VRLSAARPRAAVLKDRDIRPPETGNLIDPLFEGDHIRRAAE
jgi:hypothetical protein